MWENLSNIIAQFSKSQKILALLIIILGVIVISVTPSLIDALTRDCKDLQDDVDRYSIRIKTLEDQVDTLNIRIRRSQTECTDLVVERETKFYEMLEDLKKEANKVEHRESYAVESIRLDTNSMVMASRPLESRNNIDKKKNSNSGILKKIEKMQSELKKK